MYNNRGPFCVHFDYIAVLLRAKQENAREKWKLLRKRSKNKNCNISCEDFANHFRFINNLEDPFYSSGECITDQVEDFIKGQIQDIFAELNVPIVYDEIIFAIQQLRTNANGGPDAILNNF